MITNASQMPLRIPATLHEDLKKAAEEEGLSLNQYCLYLLARHCRRPGSSQSDKLVKLVKFVAEAQAFQKEMRKNPPRVAKMAETPARRLRRLYGRT